MMIAIATAYIVLLMISVFIDPKRSGVFMGMKCSIPGIVVFAAGKMLVAIGIVIVAGILTGRPLPAVLGWTGFSLKPAALAQGGLSAVVFVVAYAIGQIICLILNRFLPGLRLAGRGGEYLIGLLPGRWLPLIGTFMIISLQAGIMEEAFFRGIMQTDLSNVLSPAWGIVLTALLFGLGHFYQGIAGIIGTALLGAGLGLSYYLTGNLAVPIIGHVLGNFACMMLAARSIIEYKKKAGGKQPTPAIRPGRI